MKDARRRLLTLLRAKSLRIGDFTLVSGMKSNYYFDSKPTTLDPEGAYLSAVLILEEIKAHNIDAEAIGGLTLGADPIVAAVAAVSYSARDRFQPLAAFIVRKEPKQHGTQKFIEGFEGTAGTRVIVVDDVCTTGGSTLKAIKRSEEAGFEVVAVICLVDREQGGAEALTEYPFLRLFTANELLNAPEIKHKIAKLQQN